MKKQIDYLETSNLFEKFSPIFRIFICLHLLKDLFVTSSLKDLLYKGKLFLSTNDSTILELMGIGTHVVRNNYDFFTLLFVAVLILYFFGVGKNYIGFFVYILYDIFQNLNPVTLNGGDNILKFSILYMAFINSYHYFSISKQTYANEKISKLSNLISNLAGYSICIHLCFAYFIAAIHKIHSDVWFNGVATYYTLSLERFQGTSYNLMLSKNAIFVTLSTYFTILIELLHPILVWFKKTKLIVIILVILLHLSISVLMMLYDFQIVFIVLQGFFLSNLEVNNYLIVPVEKIKKNILISFKKYKLIYIPGMLIFFVFLFKLILKIIN
ncbi:hypothetical protein [Flavobacterium sp.]|jgi:hypothetical protein|uniref:hypothetical protein n=1 Tax=Flavobacterium sp. TaxID=239 RepID=UPI0037BFC212